MTNPPGWYDDGHGSRRWWDGAQWTDRVDEEHSGAFVAATEPRKSKLWIVWVVLGAVLLGMVIAAAVLIPVLLATVGGGSAEPQRPSAEVRDAAVAVVESYDQAWRSADCDAYLAATTEAFRELIQITDCATFEAQAASFTEGIEDYALEVSDVTTNDRVDAVWTTEKYSSRLDAEGNPVDTPIAYEDRYEYIVVEAASGWAIDDAYLDE